MNPGEFLCPGCHKALAIGTKQCWRCARVLVGFIPKRASSAPRVPGCVHELPGRLCCATTMPGSIYCPGHQTHDDNGNELPRVRGAGA